MIFYKNLFVSVILSVLLILVIMAIIMYRTKDKQIYPPVVQPCPDYYNTDGSGNCIANEYVWFVSSESSKKTGLSCSKVNFSEFKNPGIGVSSALCTKKNWANDCSVSWDGVTNNPAICHE